jgi:hypothetical protein
MSPGIEPAFCAESSLDCDCGCDKCEHPRAARALHPGGLNCHRVASLDADLQRVVAAWYGLPEAIRTATMALFDPQPLLDLVVLFSPFVFLISPSVERLAQPIEKTPVELFVDLIPDEVLTRVAARSNLSSAFQTNLSSSINVVSGTKSLASLASMSRSNSCQLVGSCHSLTFVRTSIRTLESRQTKVVANKNCGPSLGPLDFPTKCLQESLQP